MPNCTAGTGFSYSLSKLIAFTGLLAVLLFISFLGAAWGQEKTAVTEEPDLVIELPNVDANDEEYSLRLVHLTKRQLEAFVKAWMETVQSQTKHAADINIALGTSEEGPATDRLRVDLENALTLRQTLFDKLEIVLQEWEAKGAKPEEVAEYRNYVVAVRRSELKATDATTLVNWFLDWLTSADGGVRIGLRILTLIGAIFGVVFLSRILTGFVRRGLYRMPQMSNLLRDFISKTVYWLIVAIGIVITLSLFGIDMTPLLAVFGGASFIIGFAMQSTLGNLASGLLLMITKPFDVGDFVDAAGVSGKVEKVSIVSTTIKTLDNQVIVVPNTKVWESVITNVNASDIRRVNLVFGISYTDNIELARSTLGEVVGKHPLVLDEPEPTIKVSELADSSVNLICWPWVKTDDYWDVLWDLQQQVKERFDEVGLSIPFPQRDIHLQKTE